MRNDARSAAKALTHPRVHLNGTSRNDLMEQYENAYRALNDALQVLALSGPNGRDYYVLEAGAFARAQDEHEQRVQRVIDVRDELLALYETLAG